MLSASVYKPVFINCIYIIRLKSNIYIYNVLCGKWSSVISSISEGLCNAAALLCCRLVTQSLQQQSMPKSNRSVPTDSPITRYGGVRSGVAAVVRDGVQCGVVGKVPVGVRMPGGNAVGFRAKVPVVLVVRDGVRGGAGGRVPAGVRVPGGNVVTFRGNATAGATVSVRVAAAVRDGVPVRIAAVVQDGVQGGVGGKVPVGVWIKIVAEV